MKTLLRLCVSLGLAVCLTGLAPAHWPDQPPHRMAQLGEFKFEGGGAIANLKMSYVTHGKLNAAKDNAILFIHGYGGNHHVLDHHIGPGRALDTDRYFIICPDALGATQTTYDHSTSPSNSGLKMAFPQYNQRDLVKAQYLLVTQALGIAHLLAVTGISSGAAYTLQFAVSYPDFIDGIVPIVGGVLDEAAGNLLGETMQSILETCAGWQGGDYDVNPQACTTNSMAVLVARFYTRDWWEQHVDTPEAYQRWRTAMGAFYVDIQDARDLYYLNRSFGAGSLGDTPGVNGDVMAALRSIKAKTLFVYNLQDQMNPPGKIERQVQAIPGARAAALDSPAGHTAWYDADPQATVAMGRAIQAFLSELSAARAAVR